MPIVRFEPGVQAPRAGTYIVTGEWGEPTGERARVAAGVPLPAIDTDQEPRWYVLLTLASEEHDTATDAPPGELTVRRRRAPGRTQAPGRRQPADTRP